MEVYENSKTNGYVYMKDRFRDCLAAGRTCGVSQAHDVSHPPLRSWRLKRICRSCRRSCTSNASGLVPSACSVTNRSLIGSSVLLGKCAVISNISNCGEGCGLGSSPSQRFVHRRNDGFLLDKRLGECDDNRRIVPFALLLLKSSLHQSLDNSSKRYYC